ncbi:MAG: hypothetical protein RIF32_07855 [Leptospirales bacterium]
MNAAVSPTTALRDALNHALLKCCRGLPATIQSRAILFLIQDSGKPWPGAFDYFQRYYPACYSGLLWMNLRAPAPLAAQAPAWRAAIEALATAMALHRIDDHLVDGELGLSHMLLQLRTRLWSRYEEACAAIAGGSQELRTESVARYFAAIDARNCPPSVPAFRARFVDQAATWTLPLLLSARAMGYTKTIIDAARQLYEALAVALRYIDDLKDWQADVAQGSLSGAIYLLLDHPKGRAQWRDASAQPSPAGRTTPELDRFRIERDTAVNARGSANCGPSILVEALHRKLREDQVLEQALENANREISTAMNLALELNWPELAADLADVRSDWKSRHA